MQVHQALPRRDGCGRSRLSKRQREVLQYIAKGLLNKQIAYELDLSERTVKMHRSILMKRLDVPSAADMVRLAVEAGM